LSNLGKQSLLLDRQKENFEDLNKDYRAYRASIDNIEAIFVDKEAPVDFIKFLEKISRDTDLEIKISASNLSKSKTDPWPAIAFQLSGTGQAGAVLRFLEKLETGPYLTEILSLNFGQSVLGEQGVNEEKSVKASLLIKVFAK